MGFSQQLNELHKRVFDDPDADEPRLAYAAHVEPVVPAQAELIRLQVERIRTDLTGGQFWSEPRPRELALLKQHGADWSQLLAPYARPPLSGSRDNGVEFNRGFPEFLRTEAAIFAELGEGLLRLGPIRHLELSPDSTSLATVLAMPALRHLISLTLENWKLGDADAAAIAACPHLERLASLGLRQNQIGETGVEALAASERTRRLVMIDLRSNPHNTTNIAIDEGIYDERGQIEFVPTELGKTLEAKHGHVRWLHPAETLGADRYHIAEVARRARSS